MNWKISGRSKWIYLDVLNIPLIRHLTLHDDKMNFIYYELLLIKNLTCMLNLVF